MAKKNLANPLAGLGGTKSSPASRKKELDNPLAALETSEVRRATNPDGKDTTMAGRFRRRSMLIEPEMDEAINAQAKALGVGKMELMRYLLAVGLSQLNSGEAPTKTKVVAVKLEFPDWKNE